MTNAEEILRLAHRSGAELVAVGEVVFIRGRVPIALRDSMRQHRHDLVRLLPPIEIVAGRVLSNDDLVASVRTRHGLPWPARPWGDA